MLDPKRDEAGARIRGDRYAMHAIFTYFLDSDIEKAFVQFHFVESGFYGGRAYCFLVFGLSVLLALIFPKGDAPSEASMASWEFLPMFLSGCMSLLLFACMFVRAFEPWREHILLLVVFTHWPTYVIGVMAGLDPDAYRYAWAIGCLFFCCLVALPRFWTMLLTLLAGPLAALIGLTFGLKSHFEHYSQMEIIFWPFLGLVLATHRVFEMRARRSFAMGHRARAALAAIDAQIDLTQDIVVRYFPPTPTATLLASKGRETHRVYHGTALVVTDVKGFTAFANRAEPSTVIHAISGMFNQCDTAAERLGVEKVSTVGDSYLAAVFAPLSVVDSLRRADQRVATAVSFAFCIVGYAPEGLGMRVGLHFGDVEGGFVGTCPPKFDLFGPVAERCKELEQTGEAHSIHISRDAASRAQRILGDIIHKTVTEHDAELWLPQQLSMEYDLGDSDNGSIGSACDDTGDDRAKRVAACHALLSLISEGDDSHGATHCGSDGSVKKVDEGEDSDANDIYKINYVLLEFSNAGTEKKYHLHYAKTGPTVQVLVLVAILIGYFVLCCEFLFCTDTVRNRLVLLSLWCGVIALAVNAYAVNSRWYACRPVLVTSILGVMNVVIWLTPTAECNFPGRDRSVSVYHLGNLCILLVDLQLVIDQLMLQRVFKLRVVISVVTASLLYGLIPARIAIYDDGVGVWSWFGFVALAAHSLSCYALELIERTAFVSSQSLRATMRSAKGAEANEASRALDIMLPRFASDKLMNRHRHHDKDAIQSDDDITLEIDDRRSEASQLSADSLLSDNTSISVAGSKLRGLHVTWDFDFLAVMFIYIDGDAGASSTVMDGVVKGIEAAVQRFGAVKIKSNGSVVLCAAGMNPREADDSDDRRSIGSREQSVIAITRAAAEVAKKTLEGRIETWSIGVHGGPCFGGIFGTQGVMFDVFGDTVNTASRFASTALPCTVVVSSAVRGLLESAASSGVEVPRVSDQREVTMKGLGRVMCHQLNV